MDESEKISIILTWEDKIRRETDFLLELDNEVKVSIPKWVEMITTPLKAPLENMIPHNCGQKIINISSDVLLPKKSWWE